MEHETNSDAVTARIDVLANFAGKCDARLRDLEVQAERFERDVRGLRERLDELERTR